MPSLQPFRTGEIFRKATEAMGLHPYPTPVAANSVPYNGFPANTYTPWSGVGFGPICDDRWYPALTSVPEALATGSFDLKTHCRVVRVLTDVDGHAGGVEYVDAGGEPRVQVASTVLLCGYTYENVRLMFLSRTAGGGETGRTSAPGRAKITNSEDEMKIERVETAYYRTRTW